MTPHSSLEVLKAKQQALSLYSEAWEAWEAVSGNKAWLRRRLYAAIVRDHLEATGAP